MPLTLASLLPAVWFEQSTGLLLIFAVVALAVVIKGADFLVEGAAGIAQRFGMPEIVIGATIVSLGTTSPEAAVSVMAAFSGNAGLAIGNGVGSIIADTGLIFGLGCLLTRLPADRFVLSRQGWVQIGSAVMLAGVCYLLWAVHGNDATLDRWFGLLCLALLGAYLYMSVRWARQHTDTSKAAIADSRSNLVPDVSQALAHPHHRHSMLALALFGVGGLIMVIFAGDGLVQSVVIVAGRWGVPDAVIASTIVALGTSLPELVTGLTAIRKGHAELLVGNVIGADILNVLFVIGLSATARPLPLIDLTAPMPAVILVVMLPTMLLMLAFMRICIFRAAGRGYFSRWIGIPLVGSYLAYLVVSYWAAVA